MIRVLALFVLLFFLTGCVPDADDNYFFNESNATTGIDKNETAYAESLSEPDQAKLEAEKKRLKKLEALGFGIFNYSALTDGNCKQQYDKFSEKINELKEDIEEGEDDVIGDRRDVEELQEELDNIINSGNERAINDLLEEIEREQEELEFSERELEDLESLLRKHLIIQKEIKSYCRELEVR